MDPCIRSPHQKLTTYVLLTTYVHMGQTSVAEEQLLHDVPYLLRSSCACLSPALVFLLRSPAPVCPGSGRRRTARPRSRPARRAPGAPAALRLRAAAVRIGSGSARPG
jgi:hypothetical protein